jgi:predicted nucleic acid-binding protein
VTTVVDASTVVAALVDGGPDGEWAEKTLSTGDLAAPHLLPVEVANVLRRAETGNEISADVASLAYRSLLDLPVVMLPFEPFADRVWALRPSLTAYDAWYVSIAEALSAPLATLDAKLSRAPGLRCDFVMPGRPRSKRARPR